MNKQIPTILRAMSAEVVEAGGFEVMCGGLTAALEVRRSVDTVEV